MYIRINDRFLTRCIIVILLLCTMLPGLVPAAFFYTMARVGLALSVALILYNSRKFISWRVIPAIILYIIFCYNNLYLQSGSILFHAFTISIAVLLVSAVSTSDWIDMFLKGATILGMMHAVSTIVLRFTPGIYLGVIAPMYRSSYSKLVSWYSQGCMPGLASHYTLNGIYLTIGLFASTALAIKYMDLYKIKGFIIPMVFILALLLTGKRAHLFFALIVLYALYYLYLSYDKRTRALKMIGIALVVLFVGIVIILYVPSLSTAFTRMQDSLEEGDITNTRTTFWALALMLFREHPFKGIGWGQFLTYSESLLGYRANVHNNFFQLLCETGVIGFLVYVGWVIFYLVRTIWIFTKIRVASNDNEKIVNIAFCFAFQLFFLMYFFTGNPLYDKETFIPYFLSCVITNYEFRKLKEDSI